MVLARKLWQFRPAEGWLTLGLLIFVLLVTVWTVERSEWLDPMPSLGTIAVIGALVGLVLAKIRVPSALLHPLGLLLGVGIVVWQLCEILPPGGWRERFVEFVVRVFSGFKTAFEGGVSNDPLLFALFLACLAWLVGYSSSWFVFRLHQVILGLVPSGVAILADLSYAPATLAPYFALYLMGAMLLMVRVNQFALEQMWHREQVRFEPTVRRALYRDAIGFSAVALLFAWLVPTAAATSFASDAWQWVSNPWQDAQSELNRVFGTVGGRSDVTGGFNSFGRSMVLKGSIALPPRVVMTVRSTEPHYWRAVTYDEYSGHGWLAGDTSSQAIEQAFGSPPAKDYLERREITQTYRLNEVRSNSFFTGGQPVKISRPAQVETERLNSYTVSVRDVYRGDQRPSEVGGALETIRSVLRLNPMVQRQPDEAMRLINDRLPSDLRVTKATLSNDNNTIAEFELSRINEYPTDVTTLRSPNPLKRGDTYTVLSLTSVATEKELREAGIDYPTWVRQRFLQLPSTLPPRVGALAKQLTEKASTPYEKAVALETYLRGLKYNEKIKSPPPTEDAVDYFLFTAPEGYCDYFSSAMVVMLRSLGIPARVAAGYVAGDYDAERDAYVVRGHHAHSWVEAFFPRYGWIEFEPTPIRDRLFRPESTPEPGELTFQFPPSTGEPLDDLSADLFPDGLGGTSGGVVISPPQGIQLSVSLLLALAALIAAAALGAVFWRRGLADLAVVPQTYEKMCRVAGLSRAAPRLTQTPEEYGHDLSRRLPESSDGIQSIVGAYQRHRFGGKTATGEEKSRVQQAWRQIRLKLLWSLRWRRVPK